MDIKKVIIDRVVDDLTIPEIQERVCKSCNEDINDEMRFCAKCGVKIDGSVPIEEITEHEGKIEDKSFIMVKHECSTCGHYNRSADYQYNKKYHVCVTKKHKDWVPQSFSSIIMKEAEVKNTVEKKRVELKCITCFFEDLPSREEPCIKCYSYGEWKPQREKEKEKEPINDMKHEGKCQYCKNSYRYSIDDRVCTHRIGICNGKKWEHVIKVCGTCLYGEDDEKCPTGKSLCVGKSGYPEWRPKD